MQILIRLNDHIVSHFRRTIAAIAIVVTGFVPAIHAQPITREASVKAVFLFNFSHFVAWPETSFNSANAPFVIGILGDDPFGSYIDETVKDEKVGAHPMVIQRYHETKDIKPCQILFVHGREDDLKDILSGLAGKGILTVGDSHGFVRQGGMVRFSTESNKIKLEINAEAAKKENLIISSKLLRISTIFDPSSH